MQRSFLLFLFTAITLQSYAQSNLKHIIHLLPLSTCYSSDVSKVDTTIYEAKDYFLIGDVLQGKIFENMNGTITIAISGVYADEQCQFHRMHFFEYSPTTDSIKEIPNQNILPEISLDLFLKHSKSPKILSTYLDSIKKNYLGEQAMINDVLKEVYSQNLLITPTDSIFTVTLDVCDYIPTNVVSIKTKDWETVKNDFKPQHIFYDPFHKRFFLQQN